jgi:rhodanese-related sulfurtransferase
VEHLVVLPRLHAEAGRLAAAVKDAAISEIAREELVRSLRAGSVTLVDVLSPESFAARHIPGAVNLPVADLSRRAGAVLPDRAAPIVAYCGGPT